MDPAALRAIAEPRYDAFVEGLRAMVDVDCGSYTPDGVNRIADLCEERFRAGGWSVDRRSHAPADGEQQLGDLVIGTLEGAGGPAILLVGHTDTVFDEGTVAERPFRIEDGRALGPGVSDMKGGLLVGFAAVEVLREAGFDGFGRIVRLQPRRGDRLAVLRVRSSARWPRASTLRSCWRGRGRTATSCPPARGSRITSSRSRAARRTPASSRSGDAMPSSRPPIRRSRFRR
ncbi:MAG: M20/M25/M40 family metallo-hydrolase [Actinomycetota bacterium]